MVSRRTPFVAGAALLWFAIATAATAAAPSYTDWSTPVNVGAPFNTPGMIQGPCALSGRPEPYFVPGFSTATVFGLQDIAVRCRPWVAASAAVGRETRLHSRSTIGYRSNATSS